MDALLIELFAISNRQFQQVHFFGGNATANSPMTELLGGYRYEGRGTGFSNDLG